MDLQPYVDGVRHELGVAAAAGGADAQALADRLTAPLDSAIRLALLEALVGRGVRDHPRTGSRLGGRATARTRTGIRRHRGR